jgi:hypothetical protein
MTRPINQILSGLLEGANRVAELGNIEGTRDVQPAMRFADVFFFSQEDFENLPADEQAALIQAGYGFGEIREKGTIMSPAPRVHGDGFWVVRKADITGDISYTPAYSYLTESELNYVAAYNASVQLAQVTSGGGPAPAAEMPLDNRIKNFAVRRDVDGKPYMVLADENVQFSDVPELMRRGWFRMHVDGVEQWVREPGTSANVLREE